MARRNLPHEKLSRRILRQARKETSKIRVDAREVAHFFDGKGSDGRRITVAKRSFVDRAGNPVRAGPEIKYVRRGNTRFAVGFDYVKSVRIIRS